MNGSILIPEKFRLSNKTIIVLVDDEYCKENFCYGEADFTERAITLCSKYFDKPVSKKLKEQTYFHELVHMILDSMGKERLKWDEQFVEDFAQRLYEYEKTKQ